MSKGKKSSSKGSGKGAGKPVKARDLKPAWLNPRPAAPKPGPRLAQKEIVPVEPYPNCSLGAQRYRRAQDLNDWLVWFEQDDELFEAGCIVDEFINNKEKSAFWKKEDVEVFIRDIERKVVARLRDDKGYRIEMPEDFLIFVPFNIENEISSYINMISVLLLEPEAQTPLSADLRALELAQPSPETQKILLDAFPEARKRLRPGWRGPLPKSASTLEP